MNPRAGQAAAALKSEIGAVIFLAALLIVVTVGVASLDVFEPGAVAEHTDTRRSDWSIDWPIVVAVFVLAVEVALIAMIMIEGRARRTAELALRESEARMAVAAESASLGLWRWNRTAEGTIWISEFGRRLLGLPSEVTAPSAFLNYIHPDDRAMVTSAIAHAVGDGYDGVKTYEIAYRFLRPGGATRWLRMRGRARRIGDSQDYELAGTVADITDVKDLQLEFERQKTALLHLSRISVLGELSGALAHELKQPLTAIMSNAQAAQRLLDQDPVDFKELRGAIGDIVSDDARAGAVIVHLRALLKTETAQREIVDLNGISMTALELSRAILTTHDITLLHQPEAHGLCLNGDPVQLQQLLLNLIINAAEAMAGEPGGTLLIVTDRTEDDSVHLALSDTGGGIPAELLTRLFDPLITTKPHGLGLGLSISKAIVEAHGGKIWAVNNPGRGATFHVQFPSLQRDHRP